MRAAFAEIVDYAGLFPPASCAMADAARQYDVYRRSADRWLLGRFVVAATRLQELGLAIETGGISIDAGDPWRLSVVMGAHVPAELARIAAFQAAWEPRGVLADSIEYKVSSVGQVRTLGEQIPREVAEMKLRIENEVVKEGHIERNVKLGRGGIREIEFVAQTFQVLHAGKIPFLQGGQT